jgi:hypothetical protein
MNFQENEVPEIHPEIRKFWETDGWVIVVRQGFQNAIRLKGDKEVTLASWRYKPINYFYEGSFMSEKKMLRLVNLKVFM